MSARLSMNVASPSASEASWDQIDVSVVAQLGRKGRCMGVQSQFLGSDFSQLVSEDVCRFVRDEKMSVMRDATMMTVRANRSDSESTSGNSSLGSEQLSRNSPDITESPLPRMAWLEVDSLGESYPALSEAVRQMHALPFELNGKSFSLLLHRTEKKQITYRYSIASFYPAKQESAMQLLEPSRGCTMLVHYPTHSRHGWRIDTKQGPFDSGIK
jgi:hypothetical protein